MRRGGGVQRRTLVAARRCLDRIDSSTLPRGIHVAALARVMAEMVRTDKAFSALLSDRLARTPGRAGPAAHRITRADGEGITQIHL